jgi:flagellar biogenesis protein FliO
MSPLASYLVETLVTLVVVIALAILVLYVARRAGVGRPTGPLRLVGRLPLEARRAVYLVRVGRTVYVLGSSEAGLKKLGEVPAEELDGSEEAPAPTFSDVLARVLKKSPARQEQDDADGDRDA